MPSVSPITPPARGLLEPPVPLILHASTDAGLGGVEVECPQCKSVNVQQLRGYWESLPAESPHRGRYAPPAEADVRFWAALLAVLAGIFVAVNGAVLAGLLVAVGGMGWGAVMVGQQRAYEAALAEYNASTICLAGYHVFVR